MKLEATATSLFTKNLKKALFILFICSSLAIQAQKHQYLFKGEPLSDVLLKLSKEMHFKVAFDSDKLGRIPVEKNINGNSVEEILDKLLVQTGYEYQFKHGNFLIVKQEITPENITECRLVGTIVDIESNESLPYATVKHIDKNQFTPASSNGTFYLVGNNSTHLNISYIGYRTLDTIIRCKSSLINGYFNLKRETQNIDKVVVKEPKVEMVDYRNEVDFATTINPSKLIDLPLLAETDVFKALQLLPGISYSENSSELNIRGGSGDQNLILFDGLTLYNLSHYYGVFSSLNPNIIKDIQVFKGGYDSRYGERVSGIVDITGKSGNQLKPTVYGDLNMISGNLAAEIPLSEKLTIVAAARRSYTDIYATGFADNLFTQEDKPRNGNPDIIRTYSMPNYFFYDFNSKITYKKSPKEEFSISINGGSDKYENTYTFSNRKIHSSTVDDNKWSNRSFNSYWQKQWNSSLFTKIQAGASEYDSKTYNFTNVSDSAPNSSAQNLEIENNNRNKLQDVSFSVKNIFDLNEDNQLYFGISTRYNSILYNKKTDQLYVYDNMNQNSLISSFYFQDRINLLPKLKIKPGMRFSHYDKTGKVYLEPRLSLNYNVVENVSLRFATGRFFQFISQAVSWQETGYNKNFWVLSDGKNHPVIKSEHYILGTTLEKGMFLFDAEAYYKKFTGIQEYIFVSPFNKNELQKYFRKNPADSIERPFIPVDSGTFRPSTFISGNGYSYGIDFSVRFKRNNFTSWLSYSLNHTMQRFHELNNYKYFPAQTDQTHQINWANMVSYGKWNFGLSSIFATGKPYIEYTLTKDNLPTIRQFQRLPNYFRTDVSANYNFSIKNVRLKTGATLINIFNTKNYYDVSSRKMELQGSSLTETNIIKAQGISLNLFLHFAF